MDATTLRSLIRTQIDHLGITPHHAARLAGLSDQTVRDYLSGRDQTTARALALAAAVGLDVSARPRKGFRPAPPPPPGRPKIISRNSGIGD